MSSFKDFNLDDETVVSDFKTKPLLVEMVPRTSWGDNLRSRLSKSDWDKLRKRQARFAGWRCEICGESGKDQGFNWPVEGHEIWSYDDKTHVQKLDGIISLCPLCHKVKHFGRTANVDGTDAVVAALKRLMRLNDWTLKQAEKHIKDAFDLWVERSTAPWSLNLTYLDEAGVSVLQA